MFTKFNPAGKLLQLWTVPNGEDGTQQPGEGNSIHGSLYAGDIRGKRAQKFVRKIGRVDS